MADSTIHALADGVSLQPTDEFPVTRFPYTVTFDRKVSWAQMLAGVHAQDGVVSVKDEGAVGDDATDDTTAVTNAITAAAANGDPIYVAAGVYVTSIAASTLTGPFFGHGQIRDSAGYKRGKVFNQVTSQPATLAFPGTGVDDAFNGDQSHVPFSIEHRITGADTLGTVAQTGGITVNGVNALNSATINVNSSPIAAGFASSGTAYLGGVAFTYTGLTSSSFTGCGSHATTTGGETIKSQSGVYFTAGEAAPVLAYLYNESGRSGVASSGRTGIQFARIRLMQASSAGGDLNGITVSGIAAGVTGGATRWDQNSSIGALNGGLVGGADGVYLDAEEITLTDAGYDVAAAGLIRNLIRTKDAAALGQWWNGVRLQSTGDATHGYVDVGFMAYGTTGGYMVGIDLSAANLLSSGSAGTDNNYVGAAITMKAGQRIYLDASGSDAYGLGIYRRPDNTGKVWIDYNAAGTIMRLAVNNNVSLQISGTQVTVNANLAIADGKTLGLGTTTGTKFGTATGQKLAFWNKTPIVQPTTGIAGATRVGGGGTTVTTTDTFGGYTIAQAIAALINVGLLA